MVFISYFPHCVMIYLTSARRKQRKKARKDFLAPSESPVQHGREDVVAGASSTAHIGPSPESKELNASTLLVFSFLFSPDPGLDPSAASPVWREALHLS